MPGQTNFGTWSLVFALAIAACDTSAQSPALLRSTTGTGGASRTITVQENIYLIQQSIGQASIIGSVQRSGTVLHQGFIQPHYVPKNDGISILQATIFPNPFSSQLVIQLGEGTPGQVWITLSDLLGRVVYNKVLEGQQRLYLETGALSPGYYTIRIRSEKKIYASKLIKE
jgi:Secretion system C-terminal sorting domain